jgi:hypothetical protein
MKAAASATKEGGHRNRKKGGNPKFISNFEVCENHNRSKEQVRTVQLRPRTLPFEHGQLLA